MDGLHDYKEPCRAAWMLVETSSWGKGKHEISRGREVGGGHLECALMKKTYGRLYTLEVSVTALYCSVNGAVL